MTTYSFSPSRLAFYDNSLRESYYEPVDAWPADAVEVTDLVAQKYITTDIPAGKKLGSVGGKPAWVDIPPPTHEELIAEAEREKRRRIDAANDFMNSKQWPGKAAIGRLKGDELVQYNLWLDYLDALEMVDISGAPNIDWPAAPSI
ncbi:tail fiber assembly protein [Salmonella enterica]|nr:tail fiber assembly protein [Salmonella enterica]EHK4291939.1 tail fiber assembly protein [Salmonella enterica]EHK4307500.1 tail fiber assembly protein [Salmonella enterica]EJB8840704.1 tail fiber assembly protein [Salmonella enterica]EJB8931036.1 tail fiber assembly protein [Salmonella enterica]